MEKKEKEQPEPDENRKKGSPRSRKKGTVARTERKAAGQPEMPLQQPEDKDHPAADPEQDGTAKKKTLYRVKFFYEWCKCCGICSALCPVKIILVDEQGHPYIDDQDGCIGCRNCEIHCPDFAITVSKRYPERRKTNGIS